MFRDFKLLCKDPGKEKLLTNLFKVNYEMARLEYLDNLSSKNGIIKVIEFGEIKSPGLSDLDWLIIYDEKIIKSYKALIPNKLTSNNFKEAFQHRPIFLERKYENYIGEFILPTKTFVHLGDHFNEESFSSINNFKRDLTVGFEFFKRQKRWLRKVEFEKLSFKKKVALFVSISRHSKNPFFEDIKFELGEYEEDIAILRSKILENNLNIEMLEKLRFSSVKLILLLEHKLSFWLENNYHYFDFKDDLYQDIIWSEDIRFSEHRDILVKNLKLFPILFKNLTKKYDYFFLKYLLLHQISIDMSRIGLKDGIIADLGFRDWFKKSIREHLYHFKNKFNLFFKS